MSRRVLGQYDLLLAEDEDRDDRDTFYVGQYLGHQKSAFDPRQFRLWLALRLIIVRSSRFRLRPVLDLVNQMLDDGARPDRIKQGFQAFVQMKRRQRPDGRQGYGSAFR